MSVISMFYGVIVMMYYFDNHRHHEPHIHVKYGDEEAMISNQTFAVNKMKKVVSAKPNDDFTLDLLFDDGKRKRFDAKPYLNFPVFQRLRDLNYFKNVRIVFNTVKWQNEQDISPDTLYLESIDITEDKDVLAA